MIHLMEKYQKFFWIGAIIIVFAIGYYLRAYYSLTKVLPLSPYEIYNGFGEDNLLASEMTDNIFSVKYQNYPVSYFLRSILPPWLNQLYLVYILGAVVIFFLGRAVGGSNLGGILSFFVYAVSSENLLQYTGIIQASGLSYLFIWISLFFFLQHWLKKKNLSLLFFIFFSILVLATYHTGAAAFVAILAGLLISHFYFSPPNKKIILACLALFTFYLFWILVNDFSQLALIQNEIVNLGWLKILWLSLISLIFGLFLFSVKKYHSYFLKYLPILSLLPAIFLIISRSNLFLPFLALGPKNYYSSAITLNNYLAQAILTHIYLLIFLFWWEKKKTDLRYQFLVGWLVGLVFISFGLATAGYYSRIFDYSFPLAFVIFSWYWAGQKKFRKIVVPLTIILLIISQLIIYQDPFSRRRYYAQEEIDSAKKVIALNLEGRIVSDLRTAALFSYLGDRWVMFGQADAGLHNKIFYQYEKIKKADNINYIILSKSMRDIVYSTNNETPPLGDKEFDYYKNNFSEVYNDGELMVYQINNQVKKVYQIPKIEFKKIKQ